MMKTLTAILSLGALSGCSFLMPWNQEITVNAEPENARIFVNGTPRGEGHVTETVRRNKAVSILVTHPDYADQTRRVASTLSGTGTADIIGGALILLPALGLLSPGAWDLQQDTVSVILEKE